MSRPSSSRQDFYKEKDFVVCLTKTVRWVKGKGSQSLIGEKVKTTKGVESILG